MHVVSSKLAVCQCAILLLQTCLPIYDLIRSDTISCFDIKSFEDLQHWEHRLLQHLNHPIYQTKKGHDQMRLELIYGEMKFIEIASQKSLCRRVLFLYPPSDAKTDTALLAFLAFRPWREAKSTLRASPPSEKIPFDLRLRPHLSHLVSLLVSDVSITEDLYNFCMRSFIYFDPRVCFI